MSVSGVISWFSFSESARDARFAISREKPKIKVKVQRLFDIEDENEVMGKLVE